MAIIEGIDAGNVLDSRKGPQTDKTRIAQKAVDEFLASGFGACKVDWKEIDEDYDAAKRVIAYRINYARGNGHEGADDLAMRSDRHAGEIYLVHLAEL